MSLVPAVSTPISRKVSASLRSAITASFLILVLAAVCSAQDLAAFEKRVTVKKLPNGLTAIVCVRPDTAPVFSFYTNVDAGSVQDPMGKTGLAHMFEHMAFKGTDKIGTKDYPAEKAALRKVEDLYAQYLHERDKRVGRDEAEGEGTRAAVAECDQGSPAVRHTQPVQRNR